MIDQKIDRSTLDKYLTSLCILHAGTFTHSVLTHVRDEIRKGEFGYDAARQKRVDADREHMDNLVEHQVTYRHPEGFLYESWLVKRERQYRIFGTSVFIIVTNQDGYPWHSVGCELCDHVSNFGDGDLERSLAKAMRHWTTTHAA